MIKTYTPIDEIKLKQLIHSMNSDLDLIEISKNPNCIASNASYIEEKMVGWIVAWKSRFHPHCTYFRIVIHSEYQESITELVESVEGSLTEKDYPLLTGVDRGTGLADYYQNNNFQIIRETYLPTINLSNINQLSLSEKNSINSLSEIRDNKMLVDQLTRLVKKVYEETHLINPVADFNLDTWEKLIFEEDLLSEGSYVYLDEKEEILAYSFLHETDEENKVELGWKGTSRKSDTALLHTLISKQITFAKKNNYQYMEGEFDTTDPYAMEVLDYFQFPREPVWITYSKKGANER